MRDLTTTPPHWPRPVPLLMWTADYADIRERVRRDGRLDCDEVWLPGSDDSWPAFRRRHGTYGFGMSWLELANFDADRKAEAHQRRRDRLAAQAEAAQERWANEQISRYQARQQQSDLEWQDAEAEIEKARALWTRMHPACATEQYVRYTMRQTHDVSGRLLRRGHSYWLPSKVRDALEAAA